MASYLFVSQDPTWLQNQTLQLSGGGEWELLIQQPDTTIYSDAKSLGIELIRSITSALSQKPYQSETSVIIIEHAEALTPQAQQAFLKLLEEPPEYGLIVLWTQNVDALLPTIRSRCFILEDHQSVSQEFLDAQTIENFLVMSIGQRFAALENAKDKTTAQTWIASIMHYYHERLKQGTDRNQSKHMALLHQLIGFQELLTKNVQPKFVCEQIAILV